MAARWGTGAALLALLAGVLPASAGAPAPLTAPQVAAAGNRAVDADLSRDALLHDPQTPTGGNPRGDVTVVAFFDYNCPHCIAVQPALKALVASDPGVRLVYKDWPIFGPGSIAAARVALAAQWQGRYEAVHDALLASRSPKSDAGAIRALATGAGADAARLDADLKAHGPEIDAVLGRTEKQAEKLALPGTPVFLVGPLMVAQELDLAGFQRAVAEARARQAKR